MIDPQLIESLRERYKIHPLLFHRSLEYAESGSHLFDILDTLPGYPMTWDEQNKCWKAMEEPLQYERLKLVKE